MTPLIDYLMELGLVTHVFRGSKSYINVTTNMELTGILVTASSGGVLIMLIMLILLFDTTIEFGASDEFWQLGFPQNRGYFYSTPSIIMLGLFN